MHFRQHCKNLNYGISCKKYIHTEKVDCHCRNIFCNVASNLNDKILFLKK